MPTVEEIIDQIGQSTVISKLNLAKGFHQVPMAPEDKKKTAFICHVGKFQYQLMPFGVRNAPAAFQSIMEKALEGCRTFAHPYIDDIVVYSKSWDEHLVHLDKVLLALKSVGLTASPTKCEWGGKKMRYLGYLVDSGTVAVPSDHVTTMSTLVRPTTKKGLRSFLGTISYYRKFIPKIAEYTALLTPAMAKTALSGMMVA